MDSLTTNLPDGTRRVISLTVSRLLDAAGRVIEEWTPTADEVAQVQQVQAEGEKRVQRSELWAAALAAYKRNEAFIAAAPGATFPLPVDQQQLLVRTVADVARTQNGILRLLDDKGLIS